MEDTIPVLISAELYLRHGAEFAMSATQRLVLLVIAEEPGRAVGEIATRAMISGVDASKALRELDRVGLVRMEMDEADRRRKHIFLSDLGQQFVKELAQAVRAPDTANPAPPTSPHQDE